MGFPGCGKQTFYDDSYKNYPPKATMTTANPDVCDSRNFEYDFVRLVNEKVDGFDVVFVPFDNRIMRILHQNAIDYDLFYPDRKRRPEFLQNFVRQKRDVKEIRKIDHKWTDWIYMAENETSEYCHKHQLDVNEYIGNNPMIVEYINSLKK